MQFIKYGFRISMKTSRKYVLCPFIIISIMSFKVPLPFKHFVTFLTLKFVCKLRIIGYIAKLILIIIQMHYIFAFKYRFIHYIYKTRRIHRHNIYFQIKALLKCTHLFYGHTFKILMDLLGISEKLLNLLHSLRYCNTDLVSVSLK